MIDVLNTPGAREYMLEKYGLRKVPVLAKGKEFAMGQMLDPFAKFIGVDPKTLQRLSPEALYEKQQMVFEAAQRYARQFPQDAPRFGCPALRAPASPGWRCRELFTNEYQV